MHVREGEGIKSKKEVSVSYTNTNLIELNSTIIPPTNTLLLFNSACAENQISSKPMVQNIHQYLIMSIEM